MKYSPHEYLRNTRNQGYLVPNQVYDSGTTLEPLQRLTDSDCFGKFASNTLRGFGCLDTVWGLVILGSLDKETSLPQTAGFFI